MFHSASLKLTLYYLAVIMTLSIAFSFAIYRISSLEITHVLPRPGYVRFLQDPDSIDAFGRMRDLQVADALNHLKANLLIFNLGALVIGGGISYLFARRTLDPIEKAMEAQGRFTADASHELRTPLTAIQTEIEVALRNKKLTSAEARELLNSNLEEVAKLRTLSDALLRLASQNGSALKLGAVSLDKIARDVTKRMKSVAEKSHITLALDVKPTRAIGDEASLTELLTILIDNAIKYSPAGTTVTIHAFNRDQRAFLQVSDQGKGMSANEKNHIFDRFYRADSSRSSANSGGYGLGLSIAKKIVELHHATIDVVSKPGHGSTFTVKLPQK